MSNETIKKNFVDQAIFFLKKNIKVLITTSVVVFIFLLIFLFYNNLQEKKYIKLAEQYTKASILLKQKKLEESKFILENIISKDHQIYSPLALYLIIDNELETETSKIILFFNKIIKIKSIDKENLNLIKIKKAIYLFDTDEEELIIKTLNPIINSESVWSKLSIQLISDYFLSRNQSSKADEYMQLLKNKKKD
jgi:predicted negative regulator of RcsB-dependent stress response